MKVVRKDLMVSLVAACNDQPYTRCPHQPHRLMTLVLLVNGHHRAVDLLCLMETWHDADSAVLGLLTRRHLQCRRSCVTAYS